MNAPITGELLLACAVGFTSLAAVWLAAYAAKKRERKTIFLAWAMDRLRQLPEDSDFVRRVAASLDEGTYFKASVWKGA